MLKLVSPEGVLHLVPNDKTAASHTACVRPTSTSTLLHWHRTLHLYWYWYWYVCFWMSFLLSLAFAFAAFCGGAFWRFGG